MTHYGRFVAIFATGNMVGKSMIIKPGVSYLCWRASIAQYSNFFKKLAGNDEHIKHKDKKTLVE